MKKVTRGVFGIAALVVGAGLVLPGCAARPRDEAQPVVSEPARPSAPVKQAGAPVKQAAPTFFLKMGDVDVEGVLPEPFEKGSPMTRAEGDLLLGIRAEASEAIKAKTTAEEKMTPFTFAAAGGVTGELSAAKYPRTAALFKKIDSDAYAVAIAPAKARYNRLRPLLQDDRVSGLVKHSDTNGYPSGHAVLGMVWSRVLGELAPAHKDTLRGQARAVALHRVIAGVHYPTDVCAGMALGDAVADALLRSEAFKAELEAVRKAEWSGQ